MELQELYGWIDLQTEIIQKLNLVGEKTDLKQINMHLVQLMDMETAARAYQSLEALFQEDEDNIKMLYCQLECARRVFDKYQENHISEIIYRDTMRCFTRFLEECKKKNGRMFFDRGWWTYRQISMNIFRIGALEYQFGEYEGEKVIELHIPSDADLSKGAVDDSLKRAKSFFRTHYRNDENRKYICNSWLMSPVLRSMLSENSNIVSFQKRFDIVQEDTTDQDFIEWLFQVPADTHFENLPVKTNLQKKVRELLLNGGAVGCAYGILLEKRKEMR